MFSIYHSFLVLAVHVRREAELPDRQNGVALRLPSRTRRRERHERLPCTGATPANAELFARALIVSRTCAIGS
jgi:hypothetical protein